MVLNDRHITQSAGFTLVELMVTLVVLAVLISLAVPALDQVERRRIIAAAQSIADQIQMARSESIKQGRDLFFVGKNGNGTWCVGLSDRASCDCAAQADDDNACTVPSGRGDGRVLHTLTGDAFSGVSMSDADVEMLFDGTRGVALSTDRSPLSSDGSRTFTLTSDRRGFEMRVGASLVGRPVICAVDGVLGRYEKC